MSEGRAQPIKDPSQLNDPVSQRAFQAAIDFYEADKDLTRAERELLSKAYSRVSYTTLAVGWTSFFAVTSIPFYRQKLRTGAIKGTNVGLAVLFGMFGMMVASPFGASKAYTYQLENLKNTNQNCYNVAKILKPSESTKWMMYYSLTKDHPEHIMKDPRSQAAADQRAKTIYSGRDPFGLYSGPRADAAKGPSSEPYPGEEIIQPDDPFDNDETTKEKNEPQTSSWQKIRTDNGISSNSPGAGTSWSRVRSNQSYNNSNNHNYNSSSSKNLEDPSLADQQSEFDKLLEQERLGSAEQDELENWRR